MKKLLIGLLALGSISVFANCNVKIGGNLNTKNLKFAKKVLGNKKYKVADSINSEFNYIISINAIEGQTSEAQLVRVVRSSLSDSSGVRIEESSKEKRMILGGLIRPRWKRLIKEALYEIPSCK